MGYWGWLSKLFRPADESPQGDDKTASATSRRHGELALERARVEVTRRGWEISAQDAQLLHHTLVVLRGFGFLPKFLPDAAYVAHQLDGDLSRLRASPYRVLLGLRAMEDEPLFSRVLLPEPDGVTDDEAYVDLLWEASAVVGTSEYLSGVNWNMDPERTKRGFLSYTFAQRRHTIRIRIDLGRWDGEALRQLATSITPSTYDVIFDDASLFCWVPAKRSDEFLALLAANPESDD